MKNLKRKYEKLKTKSVVVLENSKKLKRKHQKLKQKLKPLGLSGFRNAKNQNKKGGKFLVKTLKFFYIFQIFFLPFNVVTTITHSIITG